MQLRFIAADEPMRTIILLLMMSLAAGVVSGQSAEEHMERGMAKYEQKDYKGALREYNRALRIEPKNAEAYLHRSKAKLQLYNNEGALKDCEAAIKIDSTYSDAFVWRGKVKVFFSDNAGAIADYQKAIQLDSSNADAYVSWGYAIYLSNEYRNELSSSIEKFDKALAINPKHRYAYFYRGQVKAALGEHEGALIDYKLASEVNSTLGKEGYFICNRGASKASTGDFEGAIEDFTFEIEAYPKSSIGYSSRGEIKALLSDHSGAIEDYDRAIKINPKREMNFCQRGYSKAMLGDYKGAIEDYKKALKIEPDLAKAYIGLGDVRSRLGEYEAAVKYYDKAFGDIGDRRVWVFESLHPVFKDYNNSKAYCYRNRGSAKHAIGDLTGACADWAEAARLGDKEAAALLKDCCP